MAPTIVDARVQYPRRTEAAYPDLLCDRISSILLAIVISQAIVAFSLPEHAQSHGETLNRVVMGALPGGKHIKPLESLH